MFIKLKFKLITLECKNMYTYIYIQDDPKNRACRHRTGRLLRPKKSFWPQDFIFEIVFGLFGLICVFYNKMYVLELY